MFLIIRDHFESRHVINVTTIRNIKEFPNKNGTVILEIHYIGGAGQQITVSDKNQVYNVVDLSRDRIIRHNLSF